VLLAITRSIIVTTAQNLHLASRLMAVLKTTRVQFDTVTDYTQLPTDNETFCAKTYKRGHRLQNIHAASNKFKLMQLLNNEY
jgi:hypothetical protein